MNMLLGLDIGYMEEKYAYIWNFYYKSLNLDIVMNFLVIWVVPYFQKSLL
jgi:hypothetical protein